MNLIEEIKLNRRAIKELTEVKSFLDKYLIDVDDFTTLIPQMGKELRNTKLPISLFDGEEVYATEVINEENAYDTHCRYNFPIIVGIRSSECLFYYYENGNYNIDKDIEDLRSENIRLEARRKELSA